MPAIVGKYATKSNDTHIFLKKLYSFAKIQTFRYLSKRMLTFLFILSLQMLTACIIYQTPCTKCFERGV